jgi:hypothetical protein
MPLTLITTAGHTEDTTFSLTSVHSSLTYQFLAPQVKFSPGGRSFLCRGDSERTQSSAGETGGAEEGRVAFHNIFHNTLPFSAHLHHVAEQDFARKA